jgi:hypothetical protein
MKEFLNNIRQFNSGTNSGDTILNVVLLIMQRD